MKKLIKNTFISIWIIATILFVAYSIYTTSGNCQQNYDRSLSVAEWTINK